MGIGELMAIVCLVSLLFLALIAVGLVLFVATAGSRNHDNLEGLQNDGHPQYLRVDGSRDLAGDWSAAGHKVMGLPEARAIGEAVPFQQAVKRGDPGEGDLGGQYPAATVIALQGRLVADRTPEAGEVLTWDQNLARWEPRLVGGAAVESDLVRVQALSWAHAGESSLRLTLDGTLVRGVMVTFSGPVQASTLNGDTVAVFAERSERGGFLSFQRVVAQEIIPVEPQQESAGSTTDADVARGVAFMVSPGQFGALEDRRLWVVLRADFILDPGGRPLDGEHLRGVLPSGDGRPGGRFESWLKVHESALDINLAGASELEALPGIGPELADRILATRRAMGGFSQLEDLLAVPGIGPRLFDRLRTLLSIGG